MKNSVHSLRRDLCSHVMVLFPIWSAPFWQRLSTVCQWAMKHRACYLFLFLFSWKLPWPSFCAWKITGVAAKRDHWTFIMVLRFQISKRTQRVIKISHGGCIQQEDESWVVHGCTPFWFTGPPVFKIDKQGKLSPLSHSWQFGWEVESPHRGLPWWVCLLDEQIFCWEICESMWKPLKKAVWNCLKLETFSVELSVQKKSLVGWVWWIRWFFWTDEKERGTTETTHARLSLWHSLPHPLWHLQTQFLCFLCLLP